jgi:hypothetical protein
MNIIPSSNTKEYGWRQFCYKWIKDTKDQGDIITASMAIDILREFFGSERPILLLIDELSKAKEYDITVITAVGNILDTFGDVDVIVSSLSPNYIKNLVTTESQRSIKYTILRPLVDFEYMKDASKLWVNDFLTFSRIKVDNVFVLHLLKSIYLMVSGDPRSLQYLSKDVLSRPDNSSVLKKLSTWLDAEYCDVIKYLSDQIALLLRNQNGFPLSIDLKDLDLFALNAVPFSEESSEFRIQLESGIIFLQREEEKSFYPAIRAYHLFLAIFSLKIDPQWKNENLSPRLKAFNTLFSGSIDSRISEVWERCIVMTIFSRAFSGAYLNDVFGTTDLPIHFFKDPVIKKASTKITFKTVKESTIFLPFKNQIAIDCFVYTNKLHIYTQKKIAISSVVEKSPTFIRAKTIKNIILHELGLFGNDNLGIIHIIFYDWGSVDIESHTEVVKKILDELLAMDQSKSSVAYGFVDRFRNNIHIVNRKGISNWILPSFLPVAYLTNE